MSKRNGNISPITFIDKVIKKNELGQPFSLFAFQREILSLAFAFDGEGKLPYDTILYSCPKKSGKSTINGALTLWWALTEERRRIRAFYWPTIASKVCLLSIPRLRD